MNESLYLIDTSAVINITANMVHPESALIANWNNIVFPFIVTGAWLRRGGSNYRPPPASTGWLSFGPAFIAET